MLRLIATIPEVSDEYIPSGLISKNEFKEKS